jgi:hypothetical protein
MYEVSAIVRKRATTTRLHPTMKGCVPSGYGHGASKRRARAVQSTRLGPTFAITP